MTDYRTTAVSFSVPPGCVYPKMELTAQIGDGPAQRVYVLNLIGLIPLAGDKINVRPVDSDPNVPHERCRVLVVRQSDAGTVFHLERR